MEGCVFQFHCIFGLIINSAKTKGDFPWGRISAYFTIRKEIIGLSIPLLAETQLYGGLGFNKHWVLPVMTTDMFNSASFKI
mgnify:CR=1 FL=1